jgi:uncharacterized membrane protein YeiH
MVSNKILDFIASKWFVLAILVMMSLFIPTTWSNLKIVMDAGMLGKFWYIGLVFACNVLGALFAFWKFMALITTKKAEDTSW